MSACSEVPAPLDASAKMRDVVTPDGTKLSQTCVPTGPERCFDAKDDNCNGVIDEGCGLQTGVLQFTIAWGEATADVDLEVTDPDGDLATTDGPTRSGLSKDRDCPRAGADCYGQNVENVYLGEGEPARGRYRVVVRLDAIGQATPPLRVHLGARVGQRTFGIPLELSPGRATEEKVFEFTL
jgi:hypothetical protein